MTPGTYRPTPTEALPARGGTLQGTVKTGHMFQVIVTRVPGRRSVPSRSKTDPGIRVDDWRACAVAHR